MPGKESIFLAFEVQKQIGRSASGLRRNSLRGLAACGSLLRAGRRDFFGKRLLYGAFFCFRDSFRGLAFRLRGFDLLLCRRRVCLRFRLHGLLRLCGLLLMYRLLRYFLRLWCLRGFLGRIGDLRDGFRVCRNLRRRRQLRTGRGRILHVLRLNRDCIRDGLLRKLSLGFSLCHNRRVRDGGIVYRLAVAQVAFTQVQVREGLVAYYQHGLAGLAFCTEGIPADQGAADGDAGLFLGIHEHEPVAAVFKAVAAVYMGAQADIGGAAGRDDLHAVAADVSLTAADLAGYIDVRISVDAVKVDGVSAHIAAVSAGHVAVDEQQPVV